MNTIDLCVKPCAFGETVEVIGRKDTRYTSNKITYKGKRYTIRGGIRSTENLAQHWIYLNEHKRKG